MSVFGVILVRIFPAFSSIQTENGEKRTRITPNMDTFYAVGIFIILKILLAVNYF